MSLLHDATDEAIEAELPPAERRWLKWLRRTGWALVGLYFVAAIAMLALRFWVLPAVADHKPEIEAAVSRALGERVEIDGIEAEWFGFHPRLELTGVRIFDRAGKEALELPYVAVSVAWRSIVAGELRFRSVVLDRPDLVVRRDRGGRLLIAGLEMKPESGGDVAASDWLVRQGEILVRDATVEWIDERRGAAPLRLERVGFLLENDGRRHRFALRAEPPRELGSPLDVRGDLVGRSLADLASWSGRVYAAFDHVDLAGWHAWVDYPFEVRSGRGALRVWVGFAERALTELSADVALDDVAGRFARELPAFDMQSMRGQFGAKRTQAFELIDLDGAPDVVYSGYARQLALVPRGQAALAPADFTGRWWPAQGRTPPRGEATVRALDLGQLAQLGEHVPLPGDARTALVAIAPKGRLTDVAVGWTGDLERPASYSARGRFAGLGMKPYERVPGFDRLDGAFDVTDKGGSLTIQAAHSTFDSARHFADRTLAFDTLNARASWSFPQGDLVVKLEDVAFANAEIAGSIAGTVRTGARGSRGVDLTARLARATGKAVYRYVPALPPEVAAWLRARIQAGTVGETRIRLRGDLDDFPFRDPKSGEFKATGRVTDGTLEYADGWPKLTAITADLAFDGPQFRISSPRASSLGVQIAPATVQLLHLYDAHVPTRVVVDGEANGPLGGFLRFIAESPVKELLDHLTTSWSGEGRAALKLRFELPLDAPERTTVAGTFQFTNNAIAMGPGEPKLEQVTGRVEFTEAGASTRGLAAHTLGGSINVQIATREGTTTATVQGTVDSRELARSAELPIADRVRGPLAFKAVTTASRGRKHSSLESSLAGVAIDLPAPFAKPAAESWPLRLERTLLAPSPRRETIVLGLGTVLHARGEVRHEGDKLIVERAGIAVGEAAVPEADKPGVVIAGNLKRLDLDRLLAAATAAGDRAGHADFNVTALTLQAETLIAVGREFHDVSARAQFDGRRTWRADVTARELAGEIAWRPEGQGLVRARLKYFIHPEPAPGGATNEEIGQELPALSIIADRYTFAGNDLGRLELRAVNEQKGWRLDKLELAAPEGTLSATGLWEPAPRGSGRTNLTVRADVKDIGKYLERFGYPDTVAKGTASLDGTVQWTGPVYRIDYPSIAGSLDVKAAKGQFVKIKSGMGNLLGMLSLQSLPRRISLDFRDVFSDGFVFDSITGSAKIVKGVASTDNLAMTGPAANVAIAGRADLANETQNITVRVVPAVGDNVALAAGLALINPIVGAGALIAQQLFKEPIGQMFAFEFQISGSWEDPKVIRARAPELMVPGAAAGAGGSAEAAQAGPQQ